MRKTVFTCIALIGLAAPASAQNAPSADSRAVQQAVEAVRQHARALYVSREQRGGETQTERITRTVKIGADGELSISNIAGDITVTKGSGSAATLDIVKTARAETAAEARELLGLVQIDISERNGRAEVTTRYPQQDDRGSQRRRRNVTVAYTVSAPANASLTLRSISGDLKVNDIRGELALNVISGNITINNAASISAAKTISGDVQISDAQLEDDLDADSVSGNVSLRRVRASRVGVGSVSGNVLLADLQCDRVEAHSLSGNVEFASPMARNGRYEFKSHSGDVRVSVAGGTGFELEANSFSGTVRSDLQMTLEGGERTGRGPGRRAVHGVYGDGSSVLRITTFSGGIVIGKR